MVLVLRFILLNEFTANHHCNIWTNLKLENVGDVVPQKYIIHLPGSRQKQLNNETEQSINLLVWQDLKIWLFKNCSDKQHESTTSPISLTLNRFFILKNRNNQSLKYHRDIFITAQLKPCFETRVLNNEEKSQWRRYITNLNIVSSFEAVTVIFLRYFKSWKLVLFNVFIIWGDRIWNNHEKSLWRRYIWA